MRKQSITVYLSKENVQLKDCFDQLKISEHGAVPIKLKHSLEAKMYMYLKESEEPPWKQFFEDGLTAEGQKEVQVILEKDRHTVSALIAIQLRKRIALVTFGHGYSLISWKVVEPDFGKKILINSVSIDKFMSVKSQLYDSYPRYQQSQTSINSNLYEFELDFEFQILHELTGDLNLKLLEDSNFSERDIGLRISGSHSLNFNTYKGLSGISPILEWFLKKYNEKVKDEFFQAIDTFIPIDEKTLVQDLNNQVVDNIHKSLANTFHLIIPFLIDYTEYQKFQILVNDRRNIVQTPELDIPSILDLVNQIIKTRFKDALKLEDLKNHMVLKCISNTGDDERDKYVPIFKTLTGEIDHKGERYALMNGKWYRIDKDFFDRIINQLSGFVKTSSKLSSFDPKIDIDKKKNLSETVYNVRQNKRLVNSLLFDREKITFRGRGTVEVCDLILDSDFYHVKRFSSSSTLSHLFFQGTVSASALIEDEDGYRKKFLAKVPTGKKKHIEDLIKNKKFVVVYSILIEKTKHYNPAKGILNLPSFSIVTLYKSFKDLNRMGIDMRVELIFS